MWNLKTFLCVSNRNPRSFPTRALWLGLVFAPSSCPLHRRSPSPLLLCSSFSVLCGPWISQCTSGASVLPGTFFSRLLCGSSFYNLSFIMWVPPLPFHLSFSLPTSHVLFLLSPFYFLYLFNSFWNFLVCYSCLLIALLQCKHVCCPHLPAMYLPPLNIYWMNEWSSWDDKKWVDLRGWRMRILKSEI